MAEAFLSLSPTDRREVLEVVASTSGRPTHVIEKDIWVVWTLSVLFESSFGKHLVFKGGTSLSKAYKAIRRFSEDVDVTYDIRAFAPDLVQGAGEEALPPTNSQEKKWTKAIRKRLPAWVAETALPYMQARLAASGCAGQVRADGSNLYIEYEP
ncbi:MAG: nucleotidyl transferase AbiEii/AbiGii toxin family protein, partial [Gammaproteobacteria bacterium]